MTTKGKLALTIIILALVGTGIWREIPFWRHEFDGEALACKKILYRSFVPRPGGNLTGVTTLDMELSSKQLELLHELLPKAETIAALINPTFPGNEIQARELQTAASTLGLQVHVLHASTHQDITRPSQS